LNKDFIRLDILKQDLNTLCIIENYGTPYSKSTPFSEGQRNAIEQIYQLYNQDPEQKQKNCEALMNEWDKRPSLQKLKTWWDNLNVGFTITSVGRVLAHSNIQRCDNTIPNLET